MNSGIIWSVLTCQNLLLTCSFALYRVQSLVPPPETRGPLTWQSTCIDVLPSLILYFLNAYLVLVPGTLLIRLTLLPISLWAFFRAATQIDLTHGLRCRERLMYWNVVFVVSSILP